MSSQNELVSRMMSRLDENTDMIPEGFYLEFCGYLGKLYSEEVVPDERRACSYCRRPGHNRRTCEVKDMDDQRMREKMVFKEKVQKYKLCKESLRKDRYHVNEKIEKYNKCLQQFREDVEEFEKEKEEFESRVKSLKSFIDEKTFKSL
jgi:hypothetical protein